MTGTVLQLRSHEVWSALEAIDPVATMAEYLIGRTVGRVGTGRKSPGRLVSWSGTARNGGDLVVLDHPDATGACVVPAHSLRGSQAAALATVAAREMLVNGGVTMAMLGPAADVQPQLSVVARHVPDISHIALSSESMGTKDVEPRLVDQLELSGIGLSVVPTVADAVFGANLVIATDDGGSARDLAELRTDQLARGALLINATGADLPADLADQMDHVYVDDLGLIEHHPDRRVAAGHLTEPRIAGDLAGLLAGQVPRRWHDGDNVLVELLGVHDLNADLAYRIYEIATHTGLGVRIAN
jgi:ornithine cyclodeaminase/alanine dehydrogenase-like protein (mu-crystallin family)